MIAIELEAHADPALPVHAVSSPMKVVGLLSGGKDSCFNLCHCVKQGHEVIALASLRPEGGKEEIDSYLYQTVGQDGLHFIAEALELPLYRGIIHGTAVDQESDYASTPVGRAHGRIEGDETEDLYDLLKDVLAAHPDIQGVSVGAILSSYQRIRVEHVCGRLGLQSLSYLWQYDQSQLLDDMAEAGMECIIIKVAGAGLGLRHLGEDVCSLEMRQTLKTLNNKWGTHPAGEGGEYETFTINCPLFKKRIELVKTEQVVLSSSDPRHDIGTVAYLRIQEAKLVPSPTKSADPLSGLRVPLLLDEEGQTLREAIEPLDQIIKQSNEQDSWSVENVLDDHPVMSKPVIAGSAGSWLGIAEITSAEESPEEQTKACFGKITDCLFEHNLDFRHIAHINLYLSSMDLFARINAIYNSYFGPSPPTRACVACPLPKGCHVKMDVLASRSSPDLARIALHVRGLSYWAPANIGPYSQAVKVNERLFIAGQIGLIPAYLTLPEPASFALEAALSFQHARRIIKAVQEGTGGGFKGCMDSCICWVSGPPLSFRPKMKAVRKAWAEWRSMSPAYMRPDIPLLIVQVTSLPKGAQVEWQATWTTGRAATEEEDHDNKSGIGTARACWSTGHDDWPTHSLASGSTIAKFITVPHFAPISLHASRNEDDEKSFYSVRAFHKVSIPEHLVRATASSVSGSSALITTVPVLNVASDEVDSADMAVAAFAACTM